METRTETPYSSYHEGQELERSAEEVYWDTK